MVFHGSILSKKAPAAEMLKGLITWLLSYCGYLLSGSPSLYSTCLVLWMRCSRKIYSPGEQLSFYCWYSWKGCDIFFRGREVR